MIVPLTLFIFGLVLFVSIIFVFKRFDVMVYRLYASDHERWKKLGSPTGYFWHPAEKAPFFRSMFSREALLFSFIGAGLKEPNQALEPTATAVTDRAAHAPRQP